MEAENATSKCSHSLADLREELRAAGLGEPSAIRTYAKFFLLISGAFGLLGFLLFGPAIPWWTQPLVGALAGWFLTAAAMCGHDGAHNATSKYGWANTLIAQLGFTLLGGLSVTYWR